jgi:hypothetical protein
MQITSSIQRTMKDSKWLSTMVVYMCSSFVHLTLGSRDLSQNWEKHYCGFQAEQNHQLKTVFSQYYVHFE